MTEAPSSAGGAGPLLPMAPRVVLRQAQADAPDPAAVEAIAGAPTVQRAWTAGQPAAVTHEPAQVASTSTDTFLTGLHRGTAERSDGGLHRSGPSAVLDVDRVIEAIEERVLAEIERRGGRYTGLF